MTNWDNAFNSVSRTILKDELGNINDYSGFLKRYSTPVKETKSAISGKPTYYSEPYATSARIIAYDEADRMKTGPIGINEIKDIDSLFGAVRERWYYAGNKIVGNSNDINESENVGDSNHVYQSHDVFHSESIAYCQLITKGSKYLFGCSWGDNSSFCINVTEMSNSARCFESGLILSSSDTYFSYNCANCIDVMFCLNQRYARHAIGNTVLEKERYAELKKKLLAEIVDELRRKKTYPSLMEMCFGGRTR